jgi:hypothetical protein
MCADGFTGICVLISHTTGKAGTVDKVLDVFEFPPCAVRSTLALADDASLRIALALPEGYRFTGDAPRADEIANLRAGDGGVQGSAQILSPENLRAPIGCDLHEVRHGLAGSELVRRGAML